ncbi:hypothetical protein C8J57DRAFT_1710412 [Mycena rebaudengoi]|nr:hypothetical protein C8J57DRAFT_1710412 [Mycena rebaudengoi]
MSTPEAGYMDTETPPEQQLSHPPQYPAEETVIAFWRTVAELTTRTRAKDGHWVGSKEVAEWNARNTIACDKCHVSRDNRECVVEDDQPSCRPCRNAKMSCDRKLKFLFESTREKFFPSMDLFLEVHNRKNGKQCRSFKKTANKRRNAALPHCQKREPTVVVVPRKARRVSPPATAHECVSESDHRAALEEIEQLRHQLAESTAAHRAAVEEAELLRRQLSECTAAHRATLEETAQLREIKSTHYNVQCHTR